MFNVCTQLCSGACALLCTHVEVGEGHWVWSSILCISSLKQGLSLNLKLTMSSRLGTQNASVSAPTALGLKAHQEPCPAFTEVLEIQTHVLNLVQQTPLAMEPSLHPSSLKHKSHLYHSCSENVLVRREHRQRSDVILKFS